MTKHKEFKYKTKPANKRLGYTHSAYCESGPGTTWEQHRKVEAIVDEMVSAYLTKLLDAGIDIENIRVALKYL